MDPVWLTNFWAGVIALAILVYVILDGYDLGVGILFGTTANEQHRVSMMNAIAPYWDGNETWLVLVCAGLFAAFPMVYAIFLPAFYLPIALMLLALIFRGVAFEFRHRSTHMRPVWDLGFFLGSLTAAFVQGAAIGTMVQEFVKRVFNGSAKPLLVHLVENEDIDGEQLDEIRELLHEKKLLKEKRRKK